MNEFNRTNRKWSDNCICVISRFEHLSYSPVLNLLQLCFWTTLWDNSASQLPPAAAFRLLVYQQGFLWVGSKASLRTPTTAKWEHRADNLISFLLLRRTTATKKKQSTVLKVDPDHFTVTLTFSDLLELFPDTVSSLWALVAFRPHRVQKHKVLFYFMCLW